MTDTTATEAASHQARHAAAVATLTEVLGDAVLAHHSERGELWVRVHHEAWAAGRLRAA